MTSGQILRLPWVHQIISDFQWLYDASADVRRTLPAPRSDVSHVTWYNFILADPGEWNFLVRSTVDTASVLDVTISPLNTEACNRFFCKLCSGSEVPCFATEKALLQHQRVQHARRIDVRMFVDDSGLCPVCLGNFVTRIRVIAHLSDRRPSRSACRSSLLDGSFSSLARNVVDALDERDRDLKRCARQSGHSHVIACQSARTAAGKRIGHVSL